MDDDDVPRFLAELGLPGIVDVHVHFLPERMLHKVWAYFDEARAALRHRLADPLPQPEAGAGRHAAQARRARGSPRWSTRTSRAWRGGSPGGSPSSPRARPGAVPTATLFPEPDVADYLGAAVEAGARVVKVHVQVGGFDPRDPLLRPAWGLLADAGVPAVVHCGDGPHAAARTPGSTSSVRCWPQHPRLPVVLAHAGMPDFAGALDLRGPLRRACTSTRRWSARRSASGIAPLPADWPARLAGVADRVVFGSDFPNIPYPYAKQVRAVAGWAAADDRLGRPSCARCCTTPHSACSRCNRLP